MSCCVRELRDKEVVNIRDGKRLGYVSDIEADVSCGQIRAIIVPQDIKLFSFSKCGDIVIPWECIRCIGEDTILVEISGPPKCK